MDINTLKAEYNEALERMNALDAEVQAADNDTFDEVNSRFVVAETEVRTLFGRIEDLEKVASARAAHKPAAIEATPTIRVGAQPLTYEERGEHDFFTDVILRELRDSAAGERIARHQQERSSSQTTTGTGTGAELVVPLYMQEAYVKNVGSAIFWNLFTDKGAPQTNSFNVPRIGATTAGEHTENAANTETDAATDTVNVLAKAVSAAQTISVEQVELGIPGLTQAYFEALTKQHNKQVDSLSFTANATGRKGVLNLSTDGNNVTSSAGSFTGPKFLTLVHKAVSKVQSVGFADPDICVISPRRYAWLLSEVDASTGRPIITSDGFGPMNASGLNQNLKHEGFRGYIAGTGLAVYVDANVPLTQGVATNEDIVVVADSSYLWKWQSPLAVRVSDVVKADTLSMYLWLYSLSGFSMQIQPGAVSWISGSDLAAPSGF